MAYVLHRTDQGGGWVAPAGSEKSYTHDVHQARTYPTREAAEADRCVENEEIQIFEPFVVRGHSHE